ncbi:agglutinin biogenesis protein MshP [Massilia sp. PAMC28688]|uniref:agglutinin biogenesis protein MshP n=1 Tax=Massilia sp. PAMC28688 TaxID=2861283 RepID=UPI001C62E2C3|nr:agglutinin biogenesis protein MshP [Massilia sp. PAMC28688]QYF93317.1 agglutinin biogenesis protein MshP [Massilia sp. PAMC28688]
MSALTSHRLQRAARRLHCRGVSLLTAVFLVVVLAGLSAAIVGVFSAQQNSSVLDIMGVRADQAARSGLEWGLHRQLRTTPPSVACFSAVPVTFAMPANTSMSGFSVTVSCTAGANVPGNTTNRWTITAVACNRPGAAGCPNASADADYVQRRVQAQLN